MKDNVTFNKAWLIPGNLRVCLYCDFRASAVVKWLASSEQGFFCPVVSCVLKLSRYLQWFGEG